MKRMSRIWVLVCSMKFFVARRGIVIIWLGIKSGVYILYGVHSWLLDVCSYKLSLVMHACVGVEDMSE